MHLERKVTLSLAGLISVIGLCMVPGFSWSFGGGVGVGVGGGRGGGVGIGHGGGGGVGHGGGGGVDVGRGGSEGGGGSRGSAGASTGGSVGSGGDAGGGGDVVEAPDNASAAGNGAGSSAASGGSGDAGDGSSSGAAINSNPENGGTQTSVNSEGSHAQAEFMREPAMLEMGMGPRRPDRGIEDALRWDEAHKRWSFWDLQRHGRAFSSMVQTSPAIPSITANLAKGAAGKANANLAKTDPPGTNAAEKLIERKHATRNLKLVETDLAAPDPVQLDRAVSNPAQPDQPRADRLGTAPARSAAVSTTPPPIISPTRPTSSARVAPNFRKIDNHDVKQSRAGVALEPSADPQIHKELKTEIVLDSQRRP